MYLLIAGTGDPVFVDKLKANYSMYSVEFLGYNDPIEFYKKIDWNIVPSVWNEPLARVCFEPKFFGIPVISSNKGGNPEAINHKVDGLLFDPDIIDDLYEKLCMAMSVNYEEYCQNSLADRKRFTIKNVVSKYVSIYSGIVRGCKL